jgi:hypothetical protein
MKEYIVQAIAQETIDTFDAHNAPELIRCKDCKYFDVIKWTEFHRRIWPEDGPECYSCLNPRCNCEEVLPTRGPDWYCADGERKDG